MSDGGWYDMISFPGGITVSRDFTDTILPDVKSTRWFECNSCGADLRSGKHNLECKLSPDNQEAQVARVSFIIKQLFNNKGLSICNG